MDNLLIICQDPKNGGARSAGHTTCSGLRAEYAIPSIAQAGENVPFFVQLAIDGRTINLNFGVMLVQVCDALWGGDEADESHVGDARLLEVGDGSRAAAARGEHRIDQEHFGGGNVGRKLLEIRDGFERGLIAIDAQVPQPGIGQQAEHAVRHAQPGAEDGDDRHLAGQHFSGHAFQRRLHRFRLRRPVAGDLIHHQRRDLVEQLPELPMVGGEVAQLGELGLNDRVVDEDDISERRHESLEITEKSRSVRGCCEITVRSIQEAAKVSVEP